MNIFLDRTYYDEGTNGEITDALGNHICYCIELPWLGNQPKISCIPEGTYVLEWFRSPTHGPVLQLRNVNGRGSIQIHKANWALSELLGCIAPVSWLEPAKAGIGWASGKALIALLNVILDTVVKRKEEVKITIRFKADKRRNNKYSLA